MSVTPAQRAALLGASRHGVPFAARVGNEVALVTELGPAKPGGVSGTVQTQACSSSGLAKVVAARAVADVALFPEYRHATLAVTVRYAAAAWRQACRRAGRTVLSGNTEGA